MGQQDERCNQEGGVANNGEAGRIMTACRGEKNARRQVHGFRYLTSVRSEIHHQAA